MTDADLNDTLIAPGDPYELTRDDLHRYLGIGYAIGLKYHEIVADKDAAIAELTAERDRAVAEAEHRKKLVLEFRELCDAKCEEAASSSDPNGKVMAESVMWCLRTLDICEGNNEPEPLV